MTGATPRSSSIKDTNWKKAAIGSTLPLRRRVRRAGDLPDAGDGAVPGADLAIWRVEAGGGGDDCGLRDGVRVPGVHLPLRVDSGRAVHARARVRFLPPTAGASGPA